MHHHLLLRFYLSVSDKNQVLAIIFQPSKAVCLNTPFDCGLGLGNLPFTRRYNFLHRCGYAVSKLKVTLTRHTSQLLLAVTSGFHLH